MCSCYVAPRYILCSLCNNPLVLYNSSSMTYLYEKNRGQGFTIVELVVVVVVIAVLATIIVVAYNTIMNNAKEQAVQSDAQTVAAQLGKYKTKNGTYPANLDLLEDVTGTRSSYQYAYNDSANTYCLTASVEGASAYITSGSSLTKVGGCPGHGVNGQAPITNLVTNPSFETGVTNTTNNRVTTLASSAWSMSGSNSLQQTPTDAANADAFTSVGGDTGAMRLGMQAGKTYVLSATVRLSAAQTGTLDPRARQIQAYYKPGTGSYAAFTSAAAPNAAGATRLTLTFTLPANTTEAFIRLYNGARTGGGLTWWDGVMLTEGSTIYNFADGNSSNWIWNGTTSTSTSTGPAL